MQILHTPTNVGGHPGGLSQAERELGLDSEVVVFEPNPFGFPVNRSLTRHGVPPWRTAPIRLHFLASAVRRYDVFHFNFGSTILPGWGLPVAVDELPALRRMGKIVIATFQGQDARPPDRSLKPTDPAVWPGLERRRRNARVRLLRYAHRVFYLNPDLREWLPGARFCAYASFDPKTVMPVPPCREGEFTVAHAPSHRGAKGTQNVIEAVGALRSRGVQVRLDLIEGVKRPEVLARLAHADIAVDQLRAGWYGGFAVEAMALGKPVLCYIQDDRPGDNPFGDELPIVRTRSSTLQHDLLALINDRDRIAAVGAASRRFVEHRHDPRAVAKYVLRGLVPISD